MNMDERNERVLIQISWGWLIRINERLYQRKSDETTEVQIHFEPTFSSTPMALPVMGLILLLVCVLASRCGPVSGLFDWLKQTQPGAPVLAPSLVPGLPEGDAQPFEMTVADEKFLAEAKNMELSTLDSCHYRVVAQLKSTCASLSEEQLAKLGVVLFNCQAEVEGRRTYPCTEDMSLKQCTVDMDSDTWNAYHIVSNRARSVCYATRQQHFRRRAELTVNALISTATSQLDAMKDLKEGQLELKDLTSASLERLLKGHSALVAQQGALWEGQEQLETSLSSNLERLGQEKALIASGQELVAQLIQGITHRMENVSEQLKDQRSEVQEGHKALLDDLAEVSGRAKDIYSKMDHSMSGFLRYQKLTAQYYMDLMGKLECMNGTLGTMLRYLDNMQRCLEERLHIIQGYLGWAGLSLAAVWTCVVHAGYFLLCAVVLTFLRCPSFSRAMLLFTVPLNAVAEVNQQPALDLPSLSMLLLTLSLGYWLAMQVLWACSQMRGKKIPSQKTLEPESHHYLHSCSPSSSTPQRDELDGLMEPIDLLDQDSFMTGDPCIAALSPYHAHYMAEARFVPVGSLNHSTPRFKCRPSLSAAVLGLPQKNLGGMMDAVSKSRSASPNQSLASNSSVSGRQLCNGITRMGQQCKKRAVLGQEYCHVHEGGYTSYNCL
ncbi:protein brambleberry isoform X2 [Oncorhynchus tshawytscha]|uniref:protein brambleberry isoform X2 n=1 Tax=Oncorhynchus tshawytscha TaxID=74940 RepID=UPI001C3D6407|nr:protein brambleberry isoform X2 [Oncorhynchus tshawytscha]